MRPLVIQRNGSSVFRLFLLGWGVTFAAGLLTYPVDTLRRYLMVTTPEECKDAIQALKQYVSQHGLRALWHGSTCNIMRTIASALLLVGYDYVQNAGFITKKVLIRSIPVAAFLAVAYHLYSRRK